MGTPVVASNNVYGRTIKDDSTGLLFHNTAEFSRQLTRLVVDRSTADRIARAAHMYVRANRLIEQHASRWASTYSDWYDRRNHLLSQALR
jgi:glycosyltransferase involved in cell wall biosynthesis